MACGIIASGRVLLEGFLKFAICRMTSVKNPGEKTNHCGELTKPAVKRSGNCRPEEQGVFIARCKPGRVGDAKRPRQYIMHNT
jgi:hypothetical protein